MKDALTDKIAATLPGGLEQIIVPKEKVIDYIDPADGSNGAPKTMNGIWWTNAVTVHFIVSFKNAVWNPDNNTASILFTGPGTYTQPLDGIDDDNDDDTQPDGVSLVKIDRSYRGYDIAYSQDGLVGNLQPAASDKNQNRHTQDAGYTMTYVDDGDWVRKTPNNPDYHIRRIVNADGQINPKQYDMMIRGKAMHGRAWDGFMADQGMGTKLVIYKSIAAVDAKGGSTSVVVDHKAPITYVGVNNGTDALRGNITVTGKDGGAFKGKILVQPDQGAVVSGAEGQSSMFADLGARPLIGLQPSDQDNDQNVQLTFQPVAAQTLDETQSLTLTLKPGDPIVWVNPRLKNTKIFGLYNVTTDANFPLKVEATNHDAYSTDTLATIVADHNASMIIKLHNNRGKAVRFGLPDGSPGGTFHITLTRRTPHLVSRGPLSLNGQTVDATLGSIDDIDIYDTADMPDKGGTFPISPAIGPKNCCFYLARLGEDASEDGDFAYQMVGDTISTRDNTTIYLNGEYTKHVGVTYTGDYNTSNPNLKYHFTLSPRISSFH